MPQWRLVLTIAKQTPGFSSWDLYDRKSKPTPESCPVTSTLPHNMYASTNHSPHTCSMHAYTYANECKTKFLKKMFHLQRCYDEL